MKLIHEIWSDTMTCRRYAVMRKSTWVTCVLFIAERCGVQRLCIWNCILTVLFHFYAYDMKLCVQDL